MLSVYSHQYPPCTSDDINYKRCRCPKWINVSWDPMAHSFAGVRKPELEKTEDFKQGLESGYAAKQNSGREVVDVAPENIVNVPRPVIP